MTIPRTQQVHRPCPRPTGRMMVYWLSRLQRWADRKDGSLFLPKSMFLLLNIILYTTYTYQLDYIIDKWRLDISYFGFITCIPAFSFFSAIAWSTLAQRSGWYKGIILFVGCTYSLLFSSLYFLQPVLIDHSESVRFYVLLLIYGSMSLLASSFFPLVDHTIYSKLAKDTRFSPESFGRLRLWGTIGQGLAGFVSGQCIKLFGYESIFALSACASLLFVLAVLVGISSEDGVSEEKKVEKKSESLANSCVAFRTLFGVEFVLFLFVVLTASYARATVGNYLMHYLSVYLDIQSQWSSVLLLIRTVPEILCFFLTKNLLLSIGVYNLLLLAQLAGLIRVATYTWLPRNLSWTPFVIESLRGVNNAFLHSAGVRLAYELVSPEARAIAQGFFHGIVGNLATGLTGIIGSWIASSAKTQNPTISDADTIKLIFKYASYASFLGLFFYVASYYTFWRNKKTE